MSGQLQFRGGAGGMTADLDDMRATASVLGARSGALLGLAVHARGLTADPVLLLSAPLAPASAARAEAHLLQAALDLVRRAARVEALAALLAGRAELVAAADSARDAAGAAAEQAVGRLVADLAVPLGATALGGAALWAGADAAGRTGSAVLDVLEGRTPLAGLQDRLAAVPGAVLDDAGRDAALLLRDHPGLTDLAAGALPGLLDQLAGPLAPVVPDDPDGVLRALLAVSAPLGLLRDRPVAVTAQSAPVRRDVRSGAALWASAVQLFGTVADDPERTAVRVVRVLGPAGQPRWVVQVPGTQEWSPVASGDPDDLTSDVALMSGGRAALADGVVAALHRTGVGPGDDVLLMGHSQGGMVAAALAADPAVRRQFHVTTVLTAGSPVARVPVPADVQVVALEHVQDPVPRLDSARDPDRPTWTTVTRDVRAELVEEDRAGQAAAPAGTAYLPHPSAPHDALRYAETAGLLDDAAARAAAGSRDPQDLAALRVRDVLAPFLGSGVSVDLVLQRASQ